MRRSDRPAGRSALPARLAHLAHLAGALSATLLLLTPTLAGAYCRTANCPSQEDAWQVCEPAEPDDCGAVLHWDKRCIGYTIQKDASSQATVAETEDLMAKAFAAWTGADCGAGEGPSVEIEYQGTVECALQEYNTELDRGNANIIMFRDDDWPYQGTANILALTTVTYSTESSEIYDADMEINSHDVQSLTLPGDAPEYDLLSIVTHEAGHFLGLAHSHDLQATMFKDYKVGTTDLRDLTADDVAGICAVFPPGEPASAECDATPRHGFASLCGDDQPPPGGCAVARAGGDEGDDGSTAPLAWITGALGLAAAARLRRRRFPV